MEFTHVDSAISIYSETFKKAKAIFDGLLIDLGARETNFFCGSRLGGDNFKLLVLYSFNHELITGSGFYVDSGRKIKWGVDYLLTTPFKKIRLDVEDLFGCSIYNTDKYMALAILSTVNSKTFITSCEEYKGEFTYIQKLIKRAEFDSSFIASMNNIERLVLACNICVQCSKDLDAGKTALIDEYAIALGMFDKETILLSVRKFIGIDRLVRHDLDENKNWFYILNRINKALSVVEET